MGLYEDDDDDDSHAEQEYYKSRMTGSYIAYHARKQLAFGKRCHIGASLALLISLQISGGLFLPCGLFALLR